MHQFLWFDAVSPQNKEDILPQDMVTIVFYLPGFLTVCFLPLRSVLHFQYFVRYRMVKEYHHMFSYFIVHEKVGVCWAKCLSRAAVRMIHFFQLARQLPF